MMVVCACLTFEVSWRQRRDVLDSKRKMGRRPCAWWPVRHAVGAQLDRRVRQRRRTTARTVFGATGLGAEKVVGRCHSCERSRCMRKQADDGQRYLPGAGSGAKRRPTNTLLKLREAH